VSGTVVLELAGGGDEKAGSAQFPHVLCDVALVGAAAEFARRLEHRFLSEAGWDPAARMLRPPAEHRFLGRPVCMAPGCTATANGVCSECRRRLERAGWDLADARLLPLPSGRAWTRPGDGACRIEQCPRPWVNAEHPLCRSHLDDQQALGMDDVAEFAALTDTRPLLSLGVCAVAACNRQLPTSGVAYCDTHRQRLRQSRREGMLDETRWRATESPVTRAGRVSLAALTPLIVVQVLFGLQQRAAQGIKTRDGVLRWICDELRRQQVATLGDVQAPPTLGNDRRGTLNSLRAHARRALLSPETEVDKDSWDMSVFGHAGTLSFTAISQPWLRAAAKTWASHDLPRRRGRYGGDKTRHHLASLGLLSGSLRNRPDDGTDPTSLGRVDIEAFLARLAYLQSAGVISGLTRHLACLEVRAVLSVLRPLGLTVPGHAAAGLGELFTVRRDDIPARPERAEPGRDLPAQVTRQLCQHLDEITSPQVRTAVQIAMDTGRRPEEICTLAYDCLTRDKDGGHVLIYDNHKTNRLGRRLPVSGETAETITTQQQRVRRRYPQTSISKLKLLPAFWRNPDGERGLTVATLENQHRQWVEALPPLLTDDGTEFDKTKIVPYAYRHTYAQRHADAGVGIDVLAELLDHRNLNVTRGYYRVGEDRRRAAVDIVTAMSFDRHGNRIWRDAQALLDSEHARYAVGEVAVPYGRCTEPSNVAAGGGACPVRFRCAGCDHFRTDVSYLPDLSVYLDDLLQTRERLAAAIDGVDDWARADATPTQQEITLIRRLIGRINGGLEQAGDTERAAIDEAVTVLRRHRTVSLGMPAIRTSTPDALPEANA
jgi:integrase